MNLVVKHVPVPVKEYIKVPVHIKEPYPVEKHVHYPVHVHGLYFLFNSVICNSELFSDLLKIIR